MRYGLVKSITIKGAPDALLASILVAIFGLHFVYIVCSVLIINAFN